MATNLVTMGDIIDNSLSPEDAQPNNAHGNKNSNNNVCNDDLVEGDKILSPNHLLNTFINNSEDLLKRACKDDNNYK